MAWTDLKATVAEIVKTNGAKSITGALLQSTLFSIVDQLGLNSQFRGFADPTTNPGSPGNDVFYFCSKPGVYANFSGVQINNPQLHILSYSKTSGIWSKTQLTQPSDEYNVTINNPLPLGQFYSMTTAAQAVPEEMRKQGLIVIYESASGVWNKMQFKGVGNNIVYEWGISVHWVKEDSMILDLNYMFEKSYDSIFSARNIVPLKYRKYGVILQYKLDDGSRICERYYGTTDYLTSDSWYGNSAFENVYFNGSISPSTQSTINLNQFYINGVFNASLYRKNVLGQSLAFDWNGSARNIIPDGYRKKGLIISYCTPDEDTWFLERFIGITTSNPEFYENISWEPIENQTYIRQLADEQINVYKSTINPDLNSIKFLVPDKMYFVKGRKLPFYRESMFLESSKDRLKNWEIAMNTVSLKKEGFCHIVNGHVNIDGDSVGTTIDLSIKKIGTTWPYYGKLITSSVVDPVTKMGLTPKILMIGDSITNRYIPSNTKSILNIHGINPVMLGTLTNLGGEKGEGRENWTLSNILGWENMWGQPGDNQTITPSDATATTLYQNPFLKLANSNDKTYYPDYCFRSTGAKKELNYSEDSNKSGDFYIFSFNKYVTMSLQGNVPDVITIALGTNDSNKGSGGFYPDVTTPALLNSRYWKALNFIITNIIENYPTIKIGIIPQYSRFDDYMWMDGAYSIGLIQSTIKNVRTKNNANIDVIGVWNNVNRYYCSNGKLRTTLDPDMLVDTVSNNGDTLHYDPIGQSEIANSIACFIINKI